MLLPPIAPVKILVALGGGPILASERAKIVSVTHREARYLVGSVRRGLPPAYLDCQRGGAARPQLDGGLA